ncbi:winged helix-turn-helix transcriptional regulator [Elizabethkingia miricola]|uniref:winged helix-turn-helix transcriptional regulator n=1 Tax=Elizabethkingia miricola TaxID=172045 RepID=UPI003892BB04
MRATSIIANKEINKESIYDRIIKGLMRIKKGSFRDIAEASGLSEQQVWKRLSELERMGVIEYTDEIRICKISGRSVGVWRLL